MSDEAGESYERRQESELISGIGLVQLLAFAQLQPMTHAVREYRAALRGG